VAAGVSSGAGREERLHRATDTRGVHGLEAGVTFSRRQVLKQVTIAEYEYVALAHMALL
jgi:hypothetical protein